MTFLAQFNRAAARVLMGFSATALLLMTGIVGWQVFGRYVLDASPDWSEQAALVLMVWFVMLAGAAGVYERFHIRITALQDMMADGPRMWVRKLVDIATLLVGLAMLAGGIELVRVTWVHSVPTLGIPRGSVYLALPIGGFFIALFSLENVVQPREIEPVEDDAGPEDAASVHQEAERA